MIFPQPSELTITEVRHPVAGRCERCGADGTLQRYKLVDYRGWLRVIKCRACLAVAQREPIESPVLSGDLS